MDLKTCTPKQWIENDVDFTKRLEVESVWNEFPLLNVTALQHIQDASLVRFRGMIQDMHGPEYYLEKFDIINRITGKTTCGYGKYCDGTIMDKDESVDFEGCSSITSERQTYVVVSTPGINSWVSVFEEENYNIAMTKLQPESVRSKRSCDEIIEDDNMAESSSSANQSKKSNIYNIEVTKQDNHILSEEGLINFPLPNQPNSKMCHVKIYSNSENLKLNEHYEFVGFLGTNPITDAAYQGDDNSENTMEMETTHPPSSLVPRIHCVGYRKLIHCNPLLPLKVETMPFSTVEFLRKELHNFLTQLLLGDALAAEYLIFHLISEVYSRQDLLPLGKFSLNISNISKINNINYSMHLYKIIENLVTKSFFLPLTLENLNNLSFVPKKDYECNRLTSGILQVTSNTLIVLDETELTVGKLNVSGVSNLKAISSAIKNQSVSYDFNYYRLDFDCDIPFLILSEGKSLLNCDVHVVLQPDQICVNTFPEILEAIDHFLKPSLLDNIRKYITLARLSDYEIKESSTDLIQNEFIEMKRRGSTTADDLHNLLVLARLVCISHGKTSLDEECWQKACKLEAERKSRIVK